MNDNQIPAEIFEEVSLWSDTKILNCIRQSAHFPKEKVEAAKQIALSRNLLSSETLHSASTSSVLQSAKSLLEDGMSIDSSVASLVQRGVPESEAIDAVYEASKTANINRKKEQKKEGSSWGFWTILFFVFIIVKWIIRLSRN